MIQVNVNGGAIAVGHPLDESTAVIYMHFLTYDLSLRCTGVRQIVTGLNELRRRQEKVFESLTVDTIYIYVICDRYLSPQCVLVQEWAQPEYFCESR